MKKLISLLAAMSMIFTSLTFMSATNVGAVTTTPAARTVTDYLKMTFQHTTASTNGVYYPSFSDKAYTFLAGDYLEYDLYLANDYSPFSSAIAAGKGNSGAGAVDIQLTAKFNIQDLGADYNVTTPVTKAIDSFREFPGFTDQNGITGHAKGDTYQYDHKQWYHRKFVIPAEYNGKTTKLWALDEEMKNDTLNEVDVANVVITHADASPETVIFKQKSDFKSGLASISSVSPRSCTSSSISAETFATPQQFTDPDYSSRTTNSITDIVEYSMAASSATFYNYEVFSEAKGTNYTFVAGDKIEYDVYLDSSNSGMGGLDVLFLDNTRLAQIAGTDYADQNKLSGNPKTNIAPYAAGRWYHRILTVPTAAIEKTATKWAICTDSPSNSGTAITRIANVKVTNNGTDMFPVFTDKSYLAPKGTSAQGQMIYTKWTNEAIKIGTKTFATPVVYYNPAPVAEIPIGNPHTVSNYVEINATISSGAKIYLPFSKGNGSTYQFKTGDTIEYDLWITPGYSGLGGIEPNFIGDFRDKDVGAFVDQKLISGKPGADLSSEAGGIWYHRQLAIGTAQAAMQSASTWDLTIESPKVMPGNTAISAPVDITIRIANLVVVNNHKTIYTVLSPNAHEYFSAGPSPSYGANLGPTNVTMSTIANTTASLVINFTDDIPTYIPPALPTGNTRTVKDYIDLKAQVLNSSNFMYYGIFSNKNYTFQSGDSLEYDVYVVNAAKMPSVDILDDGNAGIRDIAGNVDQNGLRANAGAEVSDKALGKWYHRKFILPDAVTGANGNAAKTAIKWAFCLQDNIPNATPEAYLANVVITNNNVRTFSIFCNGDQFWSDDAVNTRGSFTISYFGQRFFNPPVTFTDDLLTDDKSLNPGLDAGGGTITSQDPFYFDWNAAPKSYTPPTVGANQTPALAFTVHNTNTDGKMDYIFSNKEYTFAKGDVLEYEIYIDKGLSDVGIIDAYIPDANKSVSTQKNRLSGDSKFVDLNEEYSYAGYPDSTSPFKSDISGLADKQWYARQVTIPDSFDGAKAEYWFICEKTPNTDEMLSYTRNIVITNNGVVKAVIFKNASDFVDYGPMNMRSAVGTLNVVALDNSFGVAPPVSSIDNNNQNSTTSPNTGSSDGIIVSLFVASLACLIIVVSRKKRKKAV
jgi:LPXTG-motif cell wall-anchored protein